MEDNVTMSVEKLMLDLAEAEAKIALLNMDKTRLIADTIPVEWVGAMEDIEAEFKDKVQAVQAEVEALKEQIKQAVLVIGETVRGEFYQAVFVKGRVKWNNAMLEGYALQNPEVLHARTYDDPTVAIRKVGGK